MSISFYPHTGGTNYGTAIPILDANFLHDKCVAAGIPTDWWYPLANTITLVAGEQPSEAYLLMDRLYIDGATAVVAKDINGKEEAVTAISKSATYKHKIVLTDQLVHDADAFSTEIKGWAFHSARAIDGSNLSKDLSTAYLVKFVDVRWLMARQPSYCYQDGAALVINRTGFNISDKKELTDTMTGSVTTPGEFPILRGELGLTWEDCLGTLWRDAGLNSSGAALPYLPSTLPAGGEYPSHGPVDFFPQNASTWTAFCQLLHATGNEIYPKLDGTFEIKPIDFHFGSASDLVQYEKWLVEQGHPIADDKLVPAYVSVTMRQRSDDERKLMTNYATPRFYKVNEGVANAGSDGTLTTISETNTSESVVLFGSESEGEYLLGPIDDILTPAVSYIEWMPAGATAYVSYLDDYCEHIATKLIKSRMDNQVDATYGRYINKGPSPEFERVTFFLYNGIPATRFESLPSVVGVSTLEFIPDTTADRLVAADTTDDTPKELIDKCEDANTEGTYNEDDYQLVWCEVVTHGSDPFKDNKIRWYTTLGTGEPGPTGPAGPAGADGPTYSQGCGIEIAGTTINVHRDDLLGIGMKGDPTLTTSCSISPDPADLAGPGLRSSTDNIANHTVYLQVKPEDLRTAGGGLSAASENTTTSAGPVRLKINPDDLVTPGSGLIAAEGNTILGAGPVKIKIQPSDLCGDGLDVQPGNQTDANGPVKIRVKTNVTVKIPTNITLELDSVSHKLIVALAYTEYQLYGIAGASSELTSEVSTTECP